MSGYHQGLLIGAPIGFVLGVWICRYIHINQQIRDERRRKNIQDMYERSKRDEHDE